MALSYQASNINLRVVKRMRLLVCNFTNVKPEIYSYGLE